MTSTVACTSPSGPGDGGLGGELAGVQVSLDPVVPTVARLSWQAEEAGTSWVEHGVEGAMDLASPPEPTAAGAVELTVLGLPAGRSHALRAVTVGEDGQRRESEVLEVEVPTRAEGLPGLSLVVPDEGLAEPGGYLLLSIIQADRSWLVVIDREGQYVWWHDAGVGSLVPTVKPARNGLDLLFTRYDVAQAADMGVVRRISLRQGAWQETRTTRGHHDFAELPDGTLAWLSYSTVERRIGEEVRLVTGDAVLIGPEGATEETPTTTLVDLMDAWREPEFVCSHVEQEVQGTGGLDWTHANSLLYDEASDAFLLMARHPDALLKIDAGSGDIAWELGPLVEGLDGDLETLWDHPHLSQWSEEGVVLFDNRDHDDVAISALAAFSLDGEAGAFERTWTWPDPEGRFNPVLGDARRLPGGNVISSWMAFGTLAEVTPEGQVAWLVETDLGSSVGRLWWLPDLYDLSSAP